MLSKTDELYTEVIEALPPLERLRLASLVIRNYLQQNNIISPVNFTDDNTTEEFSPAILETIAENIEDYCLNQAMDEAAQTPLLDRETALQFLEQDFDEG